MIRVRVLASSPMARAGLEALVRDDSRFAVISSPNASFSPTRIRDDHADAFIIEISSAEHLFPQLAPAPDDPTPTVLLVDHLARTDLRRALQSGVRAILPRNATGAEIAAALEAAVAGLVVLSSEDLDTLLPAGTQARQAESVHDEPLSSRELEVLTMLAEGLGNKDIAARLHISEHTVKFHVSSILGKLGATTRGEAVARGVREGLIAI